MVKISFTAPMTFVAGNVLTAAQMNTHVRDNMKAVGGADQAGCRVFNSALVTIATATLTLLTYDSEQFDTQGMHSTVTNTGRLTVATGWGGRYLTGASGQWAPYNGFYRQLQLRINGTSVIVNDVRPATSEGYCEPHVSTLYAFAAGDYIDSQVQQATPGNLNWNALASYAFHFWALWQGTG